MDFCLQQAVDKKARKSSKRALNTYLGSNNNICERNIKMKRKLITIILAFVLLLSFAAGCNSDTSNDNPNSPDNSGDTNSSDSSDSSGDTGNAGTPSEINVSRNMMPSSLEPQHEDNPMANTITWHIFDRLVDFETDTGAWIPQVATSWEQVDDTTWTFDINLDIKFHNGDQLTMDDVIFSVERMAEFPRSAENWSMIDNVSYEGNVLTIKFKNNFVTTPQKVLVISFIVNKAYIEAGGEDAIYLNPVGTGPFKVAEFTPLASATLEAFDDYYAGKPNIDKINFVGIAETDARYIALETGDLQFAGDLDYVSLTLAEENPDLHMIATPAQTTNCMAFNVTRAPFDNVNVRRALLHALDVEGWAAFYNDPVGRSMLFGGFPDMYYEASNYPEYDLEKAKAMLEAEGYNESNPLVFELLCVVPHPGQVMYQSALKSIGVEMTVYRPEFSIYIGKETSSDFDMLFTGQGNRGNLALTDLDRFSNDMFGSRNFSLYTTDEVQEIINKMRVTTDQAEMTALSHEINEILANDVPMAAIFLGNYRHAAANGLTGFRYDGWGRTDFRNASYTG